MYHQYQTKHHADDPTASDIEAAIDQAWLEQLAQAAHKPALTATLLRQSRMLYDRFVTAYRQLLGLSRQRRRKLLRNLGPSLASAALALALSHPSSVYAIPNPPLPPPSGNASLNGGAACDLIDAITAANTNTATGLCAAGQSGADTITLQSNVTLTSSNNTSSGDNGLPLITSAITIEGAGFTIARSVGAPSFRILHVQASGNLTLNNATITGGDVGDFQGGGVYNESAGTLTLNNSTISGNTAGSNAGGLFNNGTLIMNNSTISNNQSTGSYSSGGALFTTGNATISNSTISGNTAHFGGGIANSGTLIMARSLISGNTAASGQEIYSFGCLNAASGSAPTCLATVSDVIAANFNLFGHDGNAGTNGFTPSGSDIVPSQALASILNTTLANNGGPTKTHALVAGSPAIDAAGTTGGPATDQRGVSRPQGAAFDIGAVEMKMINGSVSQASVTAGAYTITPVSCGASALANQTVTLTIHNTTNTTFSGLFFKVKALDYKVAQTNGVQPRLCNANPAGGGVGAMLAVAGSLAPNSNLTASPAFVVGLPARAANRFFVDLYSTSATGANDNAAEGEYLGSFEYEFDADGQLVGGQNTLFLPLVTR